MSQTAVVLINVGSPEAPEPAAVGRYLRQFLMDPEIIPLPWAARWLLVNAVIVPKRAQASAEAYRKIWGPGGSPLLQNTRALADNLSQSLDAAYLVRIAMRYGRPGIREELEKLKTQGVKDFIVAPLFPQFARATTESGRLEVLRVIKGWGGGYRFRYLQPFYAAPGFIRSMAANVREVLDTESPEHVLFSFHGLPRRAGQSSLYEEQCYTTAKLLVEALGLNGSNHSVSFQSRLGRAQWITPYTEDMYRSLAAKGIRRLAVVCPSFVADCLETLEEIAIRGSSIFKAAGGERLLQVPCLNGKESWAKELAHLLLSQSF